MSPPNPEELARLLTRLEHEELSAEEKERLNCLLREDDTALDQFVRSQLTGSAPPLLIRP